VPSGLHDHLDAAPSAAGPDPEHPRLVPAVRLHEPPLRRARRRLLDGGCRTPRFGSWRWRDHWPGAPLHLPARRLTTSPRPT
jgi:hypothetical protein